MNNLHYSLVSIDKIDTPEGLQGDDWYCYIIKRHNSTIKGMRSGSLKEVSRHAEAYVLELNSRTNRGGSTYAPRKKA